jgi:hypothetical protein
LISENILFLIFPVLLKEDIYKYMHV